MLRDDLLLQQIEADFRSARLSSKKREMLVYAEKLTRTPGAMERKDVEALLHAGFSDQDVLHIAEVVGYYAYANRIADGLGIELEGGLLP